ncbi:hypothetical protein M9H77_35589 [Catharanthus roseus]|uniref:Uncharacterized protein n=1 Tax=Catharanthus roseus TaxID=4058 RepID=A0ACB9ZQC7_CATRO|nr:hypothetical protein M9H77_35589 [Catharanthus roseus]
MPLLEAVGMTPTGNEQDGSVHEPCVIITERESSLMLVIEEVFRTAYHMLCRRYIDQNVLAKLTKMIKDEEVASRFLNGSWHKLLSEIDEQEYLRKLDVLKMKWHIVWTGQVLHFGLETTNHVESEHSVLKLWLLTCHSDWDTVFLNIDSLIEGQIADIKSSLEYSRLKKRFNAKSNQILKNINYKISHLALKKIWVVIKRAPEINDDPKISANTIRGNHTASHVYASYNHKKTTEDELNKKDESYWEHVSISHGKIQKSSGFDSGSGSGSRSGSGSSLGSRGRGRPLRGPKGRGRGCSSGRTTNYIFLLSYVSTNARWMPIAPLHVQGEYHRIDRVSGWVEAYSDRIADWNTRYARAYPQREPIHVNL